jgi:hypothetical protein
VQNLRDRPDRRGHPAALSPCAGADGGFRSRFDRLLPARRYPVVGWIFVPPAVLFGLGAELLARKQFYIAARRQEML